MNWAVSGLGPGLAWFEGIWGLDRESWNSLEFALPGRGPELGVWRPWNPGIGGLGPVWPGLGRFPGLADFGVLETPNFPLLPGYRKTRFWGPPTGNSRNSVEFSKKQQKTAYFPLLQANSGGYPPKQGNC